MTRVYSNRLSEYSHENGGRVLLLFLLFLLALYELVTAGLPAFVVICVLPLIILYIIAAFRWKMMTFWMLFFINYFIQMKDISLPVPMSLPNEMLQILLIAFAIIDIKDTPHFERVGNLMFFALVIWCVFCTLEILNDTCNLGINVGAWYSGARLMAFQLLYIFLVFTIYMSKPEDLTKYMVIWALLSLFSVFWVWKQINFGFTTAENIWMETRGRTTHIINGGTLTRYFSTFSDAATYGCYAASAAVAFVIIGITSKIKWERVFFLIVGVCVIWGMFQSGTRTAIFSLAAGFMLYIVLSKSFKIAIPFGIFFTFFMSILIFTNIGNGNQQIRRMRSAFDKKDASANTREINKESIRKYLQDAPWGLGIASTQANIPANNKYRKLSDIPPDSEYVYMWVHTGIIGICVFVFCMTLMLAGACRVVMFKLKSPTLIGIGGGLCAAFISIQLGAYANQILYQYPNAVSFFGGLAIVYILPYIEPEWIEYENKRLAKQEERKRIKLEKKLAKRV